MNTIIKMENGPHYAKEVDENGKYVKWVAPPEKSFRCFSKTSKTGVKYYPGTVKIGETLYFINIFVNKTKTGEVYLSGMLKEKE